MLLVASNTVAAEPATKLAWEKLPDLPDKLGVAGAFAGLSNDHLLVAGGANFPNGFPWEGGKKVWHDEVYVLTEPRGSWRRFYTLGRPVAYGVSITTPNGVMCIGGCDAERHYAECYLLEYGRSLSFKPLPDLPIPLAYAAGALVKDTLCVFGGAEKPGEQEASKRFFRFDIAQLRPQWKEGPAFPGRARLLPFAAAAGDEFFVLGGVALEPNAEGKMKRVYLRDAWSFSLANGWKQLPDLPKTLAGGPSPAPVIDGRIYLLAGDDGSRVNFTPLDKHPGFPGSILVYDTQAKSWSTSGEVPAPRATTPCVAWGERFVVPSGEARPGVRSPEVWQLQKVKN